MFTLSRRTVTALGVCSVCSPCSASLYQARRPGVDTEQALRAGGLVIVVRHGATFADQADPIRSTSKTSRPSGI